MSVVPLAIFILVQRQMIWGLTLRALKGQSPPAAKSGPCHGVISFPLKSQSCGGRARLALRGFLSVAVLSCYATTAPLETVHAMYEAFGEYGTHA